MLVRAYRYIVLPVLLLVLCAGALLTARPAEAAAPRMQTWTDVGGKANIHDILAGRDGIAFREVKEVAPNFGISDAVHWLRFSVENTDEDLIHRIISLRFPYLEDVTLYVVENGRVVRQERRGSVLPLLPGAVRAHVPAFEVDVAEGSTIEIFLRISSETLVIAPVSVSEPSLFWTLILQDQVLFGLLTGICLIAVLYALIFYVSLREKSYLAFAAFAVLAGLYIIVSSGSAKLWLWPASNIDTTRLYLIVQGLLLAGSAWFMRVFLDIGRVAPWADRFLQVLVAFGLISTLSWAMPRHLSMPVYAVVAFIGPALLPGIAAWLITRGVKNARLVLIGWLPMQGAALWVYLRVRDVSPYLEINHYIMPASLAFAVIYFGWALARRVKEAEDRALHDAMTGLPNRRFLDRALQSEISRSGRPGEVVALLHVDLDRFKQVNDSLGHMAGDAVLTHTAQVIRANVRQLDVVARVGGDEFVVLCRSAQGLEPIEAMAQRLIDRLSLPIDFEGRPCRVGASIGIAAAPAGLVEPRRLLANADAALYRAKALGRNRYCMFDPADGNHHLERVKLSDDVLRAVDAGEFEPFYQPIVDARTFEIVGVEALARWKHPAKGILEPGEFISPADDLGVIGEIDDAMLKRACADMAALGIKGVSVPALSINLSCRRMTDNRLMATLAGMTIPPGGLSFELLETVLLDDIDPKAQAAIDAIRARGIAIDIDDFGSGHASVMSLINVSPRRLKIERRLIRDIGGDQLQRDLVRAIIDIGRSLKVSIVAEGVEDLEQARILRDMGCQYLQGYVFGRPMPLEDLLVYLQPRHELQAG